MKQTKFELKIGEHDLALRQRGSKHVRTARILGRETDGEGVERIWLDRVVISAAENLDSSDGWQASGAVSTVLTRMPPPPAVAAVA